MKILERNILAPTVGTRDKIVVQIKWINDDGHTFRANCEINNGDIQMTDSELIPREIKLEMYKVAKEKGFVK